MKTELSTEVVTALTPLTRRPRAAGRGFTLVEVLIAIVVAAVSFSAAFYGITTGLNLLQSTREEMRATQILLSRVEALRMEKWDTNSADSMLNGYQLFNPVCYPTNFTDYFYPVGVSTANSNIVYGGSIKFTTPRLSGTTSYSNDMRQVAITVTWTNFTHTTNIVHSRTVVTYVAHYGIQNYEFQN